MLLTAALLAVCLLLQRFSFSLAGKTISVVGPAGLGVMAWGVAVGAVRLDRRRLNIFLAFCILLTLGAIRQATEPTVLGGGENANSRLLFVVLTGFACLTFAVPVAERAFFDVVTRAFLLVAVAGIGQFLAQFVGLRLFAFAGHLPDSILVESFYHLEIPVGVSNLLKSNGLTLVEPSVFSQIMALGVIIEAIGRRRPWRIATFVAALVLSFSGTGWMVLAAFLLGSAPRMGRSGIAIGAGLAALLATALGVLAVTAPDAAEVLAGRFGEISQPGTSGHMRFVTPFWMLGDAFSADPWSPLLGIGAGKSEKLTLPYDFAVNTAIKILVEYGAPVLVAYVLLFLIGRRTAVQDNLLLPILMLVFLTGGYQDFPPVLFVALLLIAVARLRDDAGNNLCAADV